MQFNKKNNNRYIITAATIFTLAIMTSSIIVTPAGNSNKKVPSRRYKVLRQAEERIQILHFASYKIETNWMQLSILLR